MTRLLPLDVRDFYITSVKKFVWIVNLVLDRQSAQPLVTDHLINQMIKEPTLMNGGDVIKMSIVESDEIRQINHQENKKSREWSK